MKQPLFSPAIYRDDAEEYQGLLLEDLHSYPPSSFTVAPTSNSDGPLSSNSTLVNQRKFLLTTNTPVPVTTIFARNSAPLYLPNLDDYLAHLDRPHFTIPQSKGKNGVTPMFPPVDHLFASGKTIEELEANSLSPSWKNRGSILGSLTSVFIGLTVRWSLLNVILESLYFVSGVEPYSFLLQLTRPFQHRSNICFDTEHNW